MIFYLLYSTYSLLMEFNHFAKIINFNIRHTNCIINNNNFVINYSKSLGRPEWVAYSLNSNKAIQCNGGRRHFTYDPDLKSKNIYQLAPDSNIFKNQWSRGHMVPSFMMSWDKTHRGSWTKTYQMSNIIPQHKAFNTKDWAQLEIKTFKMIKQYTNDTYVITGCKNFDFSNKIYFTNSIPHLRLTNPEYNVFWIDEKNNIEYQIPNLMYQIVMTPYETQCWMGFNNCNQKVYPIKIDFLEKIVETKFFL